MTNAVRPPALDTRGPRKSDQLGSSITSKDNRHHPFRQGRFQRTASHVAAQSRKRRVDAAWDTALKEFGSARPRTVAFKHLLPPSTRELPRPSPQLEVAVMTLLDLVDHIAGEVAAATAGYAVADA